MNALTLVHNAIKAYVGEGGVCIDATAGRGYDTAFLCELVGKNGSVTAFDVQQDAIDSTKICLKAKGFAQGLSSIRTQIWQTISMRRALTA